MSARTDLIAEELLALKNAGGVINPARAVDWARKHRKSALYEHLEWDDGVAAEAYRVQQVRTLMILHILDDDGDRRFISLSIDRKHDGTNGYRPFDEVAGAPNLREIMLADALAELQRVKARFARLSELAEVWEAAERVPVKRGRGRPRKAPPEGDRPSA